MRALIFYPNVTLGAIFFALTQMSHSMWGRGFLSGMAHRPFVNWYRYLIFLLQPTYCAVSMQYLWVQHIQWLLGRYQTLVSAVLKQRECFFCKVPNWAQHSLLVFSWDVGKEGNSCCSLYNMRAGAATGKDVSGWQQIRSVPLEKTHATQLCTPGLQYRLPPRSTNNKIGSVCLPVCLSVSSWQKKTYRPKSPCASGEAFESGKTSVSHCEIQTYSERRGTWCESSKAGCPWLTQRSITLISRAKRWA